jgi:hypothetical protein
VRGGLVGGLVCANGGAGGAGVAAGGGSVCGMTRGLHGLRSRS